MLNRIELFKQLGGRQFCAMTSATFYGGSFDANPEAKEQTILFKGSRKANRLDVVLDANDYYTLTFSRFTPKATKNVVSFDSVSCDQLREVFTAHTGLYCTLGA